MSVTSSESELPRLAHTRYLADVLDQPRALSSLLDGAASVSKAVDQIGLATRSRVIVSGMGSSHFAGFGLWAGLLEMGIPAWWVDSAQLLDAMDGLVVPNTVVWLTSQSGDSAESVALLDRLPADQVHVLGVTNHPNSALGQAAHVRIDLSAGDEATVSTKSYVNTLAVNRLVVAELAGRANAAVGSLRSTVGALESYLGRLDEHVSDIKDFAAGRHLLLTGRGVAAASAQAAGLVIKEAAKTPVEGMSAGSLRHGPIELSGPELAVAFFDHGPAGHREQNIRLARELRAAATDVAWVCDERLEDFRWLPAPSGVGIDLGIRDAAAFQTLSFELARRSGVTAGAFTFASKVTEIL